MSYRCPLYVRTTSKEKEPNKERAKASALLYLKPNVGDEATH